MNIHVFDVHRLPRRVLDRSWPILAAKSAQNDPNLAPQNDPKSTKNRCQKSIEILIENKTNFMRRLGQSGGMRWPPGGIIGGSKNYTAGLKDLQFEAWQVSLAYYALRFGDLKSVDRRLAIYPTRSAPTPTGRAAELIASRIPPGPGG